MALNKLLKLKKFALLVIDACDYVEEGVEESEQYLFTKEHRAKCEGEIGNLHYTCVECSAFTFKGALEKLRYWITDEGTKIDHTKGKVYVSDLQSDGCSENVRSVVVAYGLDNKGIYPDDCTRATEMLVVNVTDLSDEEYDIIMEQLDEGSKEFFTK